MILYRIVLFQIGRSQKSQKDRSLTLKHVAVLLDEAPLFLASLLLRHCPALIRGGNGGRRRLPQAVPDLLFCAVVRDLVPPAGLTVAAYEHRPSTVLFFMAANDGVEQRRFVQHGHCPPVLGDVLPAKGAEPNITRPRVRALSATANTVVVGRHVALRKKALAFGCVANVIARSGRCARDAASRRRELIRRRREPIQSLTATRLRFE